MIRKVIDIFSDSLDTFEGQREGETVALLVRRHFFTILFPIISFLVGCVLPIVGFFYFGSFLAASDLLAEYLFLSSVWYSFLWVSIFYALSMYALDTVIITSERIIDNDQFGFFDRKVSEIHSERIQDVTARTNGIIETMLSFGDVVVQSAGSEKHFVFRRIPRPEVVREKIMQITNVIRDRKESGV